ncbi:MAG: outer membrane beta-barrel protein [Proteobacteria bacterium]|nr:hypothetical protein [Burkholderiaceae bacterium]MCH8855047.1 outer membrane beta-barrel protein [Pseudomonadota bacterium]
MSLVATVAACQLATAQTDDSTPFYVGGSLGVSHVSNIYRQANAANSDTVVSSGLLGGVDHRYGRQHLKLDGSVQNNRYASNQALNNQSYTASATLDWQTIGDLSGTVSAKSDRALADFNIGSGVDPIFKKNTEGNDTFQAIARLGVATRYSVEAGYTNARRHFTASEYDRFAYRQGTTSLGLYAAPAGNVKLGLVGRHTAGQYPRYPVGIGLDPQTLKLVVITAPNDYTRDDFDFTTRWSTGGSSTLDTRISRSRLHNSLDVLRGFSGTTGAIGWSWQPTAKLQLGLRYTRDTGQESQVRAADVSRVYTTWQLNGSYALTGKLTLTASANGNRNNRSGTSGATVFDAFENNLAYNFGVRWALSRGFVLGCQYDHASRDSSVAAYVYSANSYGCSGQAILY